MAGALVTAGRWVLNRPVERVVINGEFERVSADGLESGTREAMGKGFLGADLRAIQEQVMAQPLGGNRPRQPPVAGHARRDGDRGGAGRTLGHRWTAEPAGRLFVRHTTHMPAELPRLNGPEGSEAEVAARFIAIQEQLVERGLRLAALELDGRGAWSLALNNGIGVRLGSQDVDSRLARFFEALDIVVAPIAADVQFVDMRYTNGFSIGWKQQRSALSRCRMNSPPRRSCPVPRKEERGIIVGLDIGTSKVVAIVGELQDDNQIEVIGIGSHPSRG